MSDKRSIASRREPKRRRRRKSKKEGLSFSTIVRSPVPPILNIDRYSLPLPLLYPARWAGWHRGWRKLPHPGSIDVAVCLILGSPGDVHGRIPLPLDDDFPFALANLVTTSARLV